jgi:hypothetical protein
MPFTDGAGGTTRMPSVDRLPLPPKPESPPALRAGGGGTTCIPVLDNDFPRPPTLELLPPAIEGVGGMACTPPPDNGLARPLAVPPPTPSTDGVGGTTCAPAVDKEFALLPAAEWSPLLIAGAGGTACKPALDNPLARPFSSIPASPTDGGGGTTAAEVPAKPASVLPGIVRCSFMGKRGAGATASECPMLTSPTLRIELSTVGGGATTAVLGAPTTLRAEAALTSGAGATAAVCGSPSRRVVV